VCPNCKDLYTENIQLKEALRKATIISTADRIPLPHLITTSTTNDTSDHNHANNAGILNFEFSLPFRELQSYMANLFSQFGQREEVWFSVSIDKKTGKVMTAKAGRIVTKDKLPHHSDRRR
jgi:hypothetical protein